MSNADWWARKLANGGTTTGRLPAPVPAPAPATAPVRPVYPQQQAAQQPAPVLAPTPEQTAAAKSMAARQTGTCPQCFSGNYMKPLGHPNAAERCFDCGYPIVQSTSGLAGASDPKVPVQPARQPSQGSGFNPTVIVDRIG